MALVSLDAAKAERLREKAREVEQDPNSVNVFPSPSLPLNETDKERTAQALHDSDALYQLGRAHHFGLGGMAVDLNMALAYYEVAAAAGHVDAAGERDTLRQRLHPDFGKRPVHEVAAEALSHSKSYPALSALAVAAPSRVKRSRSLARLDSLDSGME